MLVVADIHRSDVDTICPNRVPTPLMEVCDNSSGPSPFRTKPKPRPKSKGGVCTENSLIIVEESQAEVILVSSGSSIESISTIDTAVATTESRVSEVPVRRHRASSLDVSTLDLLMPIIQKEAERIRSQYVGKSSCRDKPAREIRHKLSVKRRKRHFRHESRK